MSTPQEKLFIKTVAHRETKLAAVMFVKDNGLAKITNNL